MDEALQEKYTIEEQHKQINRLNENMKTLSESQERIFEDIMMSNLKY